jgi:hypothetical protein
MTDARTNKMNACLLMVMASYPRIGQSLELRWGCPEFVPYMDSLLNDDRNGGRKGFPMTVLTALMDLQELHSEMFPKYNKPDLDVWISSQFK